MPNQLWAFECYWSMDRNRNRCGMDHMTNAMPVTADKTMSVAVSAITTSQSVSTESAVSITNSVWNSFDGSNCKCDNSKELCSKNAIIRIIPKDTRNTYSFHFSLEIY